jgi:hypothetical protein
MPPNAAGVGGLPHFAAIVLQLRGWGWRGGGFAAKGPATCTGKAGITEVYREVITTASGTFPVIKT